MGHRCSVGESGPSLWKHLLKLWVIIFLIGKVMQTHPHLHFVVRLGCHRLVKETVTRTRAGTKRCLVSHVLKIVVRSRGDCRLSMQTACTIRRSARSPPRRGSLGGGGRRSLRDAVTCYRAGDGPAVMDGKEVWLWVVLKQVGVERGGRSCYGMGTTWVNTDDCVVPL